MSLGVAYNNTRPRSSGAKHAHEVPFEVFEQIPKAIQDPVFIMESATVPGDIVICTDIKVGKKSILVPLTLSKTVGRNQGNYIKSIYPRNNEAGFITKQAIEGRLLYANSKKSSTWLGRSRVQFPQSITKSSSLLEDSVSKELEKVNKNSASVNWKATKRGSRAKKERWLPEHLKWVLISRTTFLYCKCSRTVGRCQG